ncbi:MAG: hypothetical protein L0Z62_18600 [Gemmataceae bacterium]|nr:hypothetical protein [Gemmataceae bacterium]
MITSTDLERRLDEIRGGAPRRSPTVRALAGYAQHTDCKLAALGFAASVNFDRLLAGTRFQVPFGQSPFAIGRGLAFEKMLRDNGYATTLELLRPLLALPPTGARVVNLREGYPKGADRMPLRARDTAELLRRIVRGDPAAPHLIDGAVLTASIGGLLAYFEADALAALSGGEIRVAEVKSFPKVDDRVDPDKLGAALDQVAIYILLTRDEILRQGGDPERLVSDRALLITPRNVGLTPTLSEQRVEARIRRAQSLLDKIPPAADVAASVPRKLSFGPVADTHTDERRRLDVLHGLADQVGTAYEPSCLGNCGNARFCRARAFRDDSPCLVGTTTLRLLPGISNLERAEELTRGAGPTAEEAPTAALLERAGQLYDVLAVSQAEEATTTLTRKRA